MTKEKKMKQVYTFDQYPVTVPVLTRRGDPAVSCELTFSKEKEGEMFKRDEIVVLCLLGDIEDACMEYRQRCGYELERCEYLSTVIFVFPPKQ